MAEVSHCHTDRVESDAVVSDTYSSTRSSRESQSFAHLSHVHRLFLVNVQNRSWTCNTCNRFSRDIKDTFCYVCEMCNFYLCRSCFEPKKYLLHRHELTKTDVRRIYHASNGRWICDCCGGNNGPGNYFPRHCDTCSFDLCEKCCQPRRSTLHLHDLYKANTVLVYERFNGGWRCDNCANRFHPQANKFPYHCHICEFDLCNECMSITDVKVERRPAVYNDYTRSPIMTTTTAGLPVTSPEEDLTGNEETGPVNDDAKCIICVTKPKDATIIHGRTGHVCCCMDCARELERRRDGCPICREPIQMVIQHFVA